MTENTFTKNTDQTSEINASTKKNQTDKVDILLALKQNPFVLAPMAGITDHSFRSFMKRLGVGVLVTELISANGIEYKNDRTLKLMSFDSSQHPVGIQLFGEDPEVMAGAAKLVQELGADFVDLNFGCPVPKVTKKGAGSAILKDLPHLTKMLSTIKAAVDIPVTIKIRTGWDHNSKNANEVTKIAYNEGITWVAIHGRTRSQNYTGFADWDYIAEVKSKSPLPVIGNGDILNAEQAVARLQQTNCDGVMIGRGALKNPFIFQESLDLWKSFNSSNQNYKSDISATPNSESFDQLSSGYSTEVGIGVSNKSSNKLKSAFEMLYSDYRERTDDYIMQIQLRKFASWFSTGFAGAAQFRKNIFQTKTVDEIMAVSLDYFTKLDELNEKNQQFREQDPSFLMGGHG